MPESIKLSICIATYNRGIFIGETLDSILSQPLPEVELVIVDGASSDNTPNVVGHYVSRYSEVRYYREQENSGIDKDYDKAVNYAVGEYCWLMTDDDLLRPNAIRRVLDVLTHLPELVVVNAEIRNSNLSCVLQERRWAITEDKTYKPDEKEFFFSDAGSYLSFIGAVVIRREMWLARDRASYYGTLFIHFGVIFQHIPIEKVHAIAEPLLVIRYGNAMWTSRAFEIWMFKWPKLVWSFNDFSDKHKLIITNLEPWRDFRRLLFLRATGAYSSIEFHKYMSEHLIGITWLCAFFIANFPAWLANLIYVSYFSATNRADHMSWYELLRSSCATKFSRWIAKLFRFNEYELWWRGVEK